MKRFIESLKRLFRKKQVYIMDIEDLRQLMSGKSLHCTSCSKQITDYEDISRVHIKDKEIYVYCTSCKG